MVKGLDSYEEKEDEVVKEVSHRDPAPCSCTHLSSLSPTDGSSYPSGGAEPAGGGSVRLRGWFPSEKPEQYPNPLIPASPRSSISPSALKLMDSKLHLLCLNSLTCPLGEGLISGDVGRAGRRGVLQDGQYPPYANLFPSGGWEHGLGRLLSILDTFIFPESNSVSGSARPRRGLFGTWKLERDNQVRLEGNRELSLTC